MPWTTDCGWTRTSTASLASPNNRAASMTSSPLFIIVAESMLILAPIDQTGWRKAASGVIVAISSRLVCRKGPPDAVRMMRSTAPRLWVSRHWKIALCSESTGRRRTPANVTASIMMSPAETRTSLFANAMAPPRRMAASVGCNPAMPMMDAMVQSAGIIAASCTALGPAAASIPEPARAARSAASAP